MTDSRSRTAAFVITGLVVALVALGGVVHERQRRAATRFDDAETRIAVRLRAVALPRSMTALLPPVMPALRVVLTPSGIDLDDAALVASWHPRERAAVLSRL